MYRAGPSQLTIASLAVIKLQCIDFRSKSDEDEGNDIKVFDGPKLVLKRKGDVCKIGTLQMSTLLTAGLLNLTLK